MKVLMIGQLVGGLDIYNRNTINYADKDIEYVIVRGKMDVHRPIEHNGKEVREIPISLYRSVNPFKDLKALFQTIQIIKKEKPDLIHCHSAKGGIIGRTAAYFCGVKCLYTPHAFSFFSTSNSFIQWLYKIIEKLTRFKAYLLACSESERQVGIKTVGYNPTRALCWTNAVPRVKLTSPMEKESDVEMTKMLNSDCKYVSYIGRPSYQKNLLFLVDVVEKVHKTHQDVKFVLFGVGYHSPDLKKLKKQIELYENSDISETSKKKSREPIPEDVKFEVWRRDQGRCIICGSQENLEFDHIIPFSKGGSSTARNIQLLCQNCNRHKSDKI